MKIKIYNYFFLFNLILCVIIDIRAWAIGKYGIFLFWKASSMMPFNFGMTYDNFFKSTYADFLLGLYLFVLIIQIPIYIFSESYNKDRFFGVYFRWSILFFMYIFNDSFASNLSANYYIRQAREKIASDPHLCVAYCKKLSQSMRFVHAMDYFGYINIISEQEIESKQFINGHWYLFKCNKKATMGELIGEASFYQKMYVNNKIIDFSQMKKIDNLRIYSELEFLQDLVQCDFDTIPSNKIRIISTVVSIENNNICYFSPTVNTEEIWTCSNNSLCTGDSVLVAYLERNHRMFDIYKIHPNLDEFNYCNSLTGVFLCDSTFQEKNFFTKKNIGAIEIGNYYPKSENGIFISSKPMSGGSPCIHINLEGNEKNNQN